MLDRLFSIPQNFYAPDKKRLSPLAYLFLVMLCVVSFTPGLVTLPPTDRDESSFAQASKQMIETGNYTDIRLQKEPRYKKPIGIYWLQSTAVRIFNPHHLDQIWAYRLPSLLGAIIAVVMTASIGAILFGPEAGLIAAMMMAGCVLLNVEARLAKTDAALLGCVTIAMYALARAYKGNATKYVAWAFWTAIAAGILIKGPIILLPVCGCLLWQKITDKNIQWFRALHPLPGILYALLLILPWFAAISLQSHGAFMQQSAGNDMLTKIWQGQNRGILPPGLHALVAPVLFFPFSLFVAFALPDVWKNRRDHAFKFCLGWAVPTWIVFEASLTKLPHYVLPAYPAVALLVAKCLIDGFQTISNSEKRWPAALTVTIWMMIGVGFAIAFSILPFYADRQWSAAQIFAGIILILTQVAALFFLPGKKTAGVALLSIGSVIFMYATFGATLPGLHHVWMSREIVEAAAPLAPCPTSQLIAAGYHEPSLAFLAGTDTIMAMSGYEAAEDLKADPCRIAAISEKNKLDFLGAFAAAPKPKAGATIEGLNSGHGAKASLTLYTLERQ